MQQQQRVAGLMQSQQQTAEQLQMLQHLGYYCPGLHGKDSRQDVRPLPFGALFSTEQIVIPLFQRAYCWGQGSSVHQASCLQAGKQIRLVDAWWRDVLSCSSQHPHSVGKAVFKRDSSGGLLCIDGQQRCTTNQLLLASLRDGVLAVLRAAPDHQPAAQLLAQLNGMLYTDVPAAAEWVQARAGQPVGEGERLEFARLVPSWTDRRAFFEVTMAGLADQLSWSQGAPERGLTPETAASHQGQAKLAFDRSVAGLLAGPADGQVKALQAVAEQALTGMRLMYVEILNEVNLAQVFLWMQEKSLLGPSSFLFNAQPGLNFRGGDMVRNLALSCFMSRPLAEQERLFHRLWIAPLESKFARPDMFEQMLNAFVDTRPATGAQPEEDVDRAAMPPPPLPGRHPKRAAPGRHVSATERLAEELVRGKSPAQTAGLRLYVKYVSLVEAIHMESPASPLPPPSSGEPDEYGLVKPDEARASARDPERSKMTEDAIMRLLAEMGRFADEYSERHASCE